DRSDFEKWKADHGIEPIIIESPPKDSKINKPPSYWTQKMDPPIVSEQVNDTPSTINQEATVEQENDTSVDANINEQENFDKEVEDRTSLDKECEIGDVNVDDSVSHRESSFPQEATFDKKSDSGFNHSLRSNIENIKGKEVEVIDLVDSDSDDISTNIAAAMEDVSILRNQRVQQHSNNNRTSVNDDQYLVLNGRY
ncbi:3880_t:CDS:1, partial [Acaulospora morrowiae]